MTDPGHNKVDARSETAEECGIASWSMSWSRHEHGPGCHFGKPWGLAGQCVIDAGSRPGAPDRGTLTLVTELDL